MYFVIYTSAETRPLSSQDIDALLSQSQTNNAETGITGMLLYRHGQFIQYLEGPESEVLHMYESIRNDPRHHQVMTINEGRLYRRLFGDWSMNLMAYDGGALFAEDEIAADSQRIKSMLSTFARRM